MCWKTCKTKKRGKGEPPEPLLAEIDRVHFTSEGDSYMSLDVKGDGSCGLLSVITVAMYAEVIPF